ncbi:MAG: hypothetical protein ABW142_05960 [Thermoleophilaceae bacterium]|jgi:hypothetical protein
MATKLLGQEAVMGQVIAKREPTVVLRSHYDALRALLAAALIAVVGLTAAVVVVANDDNAPAKVSAQPSVQQQHRQHPQGHADQHRPGTRP